MTNNLGLGGSLRPKGFGFGSVPSHTQAPWVRRHFLPKFLGSGRECMTQ